MLEGTEMTRKDTSSVCECKKWEKDRRQHLTYVVRPVFRFHCQVNPKRLLRELVQRDSQLTP